LLADRYLAVSEQVAQNAVAQLGTLLPCDPGKDGEATCVDRFLDTVGKRVWRRPLTADERTNLKQAFTDGRTDTFADGIQAVLQVMLMSPQFLYRVESGPVDPSQKSLPLGPWQLANRLSYLIWGSTPDDQLMAAAEGGKLVTRDDVLQQAQRMLKDPRATAMMARFSDQWLRLEELSDLDKDPMVYPALSPRAAGPDARRDPAADRRRHLEG
jgi:hypothetical protein